MTIRTGTDAQGHHAHTLRPTRTPGPVWAGKPPVKRMGIERMADRERADPDRPLSERHAAILELVGEQPTSALDIAKALGISRASVDSSLYSLSTRGLVARRPYKGWTRA
jgi:predicted Rossmann fold nucleotide-binding protein DprA/Smf involved in DNA uptake